MNLLLLNHFFPPHPAPTGQLLADVASELARAGHQVTVLCGSKGENLQAGIRVLRVPAFPFSRSVPSRLLSYATFYLGALWRALRHPRPDVVLTLTTPPLLPFVGALLKKLRRARHYIWEMDVYPDVAIQLGVLPARSPLTRILGALARCSRRHADGVIVLGPCMRERLIAGGLDPSRIHVAENWADGRLIRPQPLPEGPLTLLYSGNLGLAHETHTPAAAMDQLKNDPLFRFRFAGGGPRRSELEDFCRERGLGNVSFEPYCPPERLSEHFASCHLGLVTQRPECLGSVVPSKIYALMAAARPVVFIGPRAATPARIIDRFRCGWQIDPGDSDSLVSLLRLLASDRGLIRSAGLRARQAFLAHYDRPAGIARICSILGLPGAALEQAPEAAKASAEV